MSTEDRPDQPGILDEPLKKLALLALPLLCFQREILDIAKKAIETAGSVKPAERLALSELHALMMILDPSRKVRNRLGPDFEQRVEDAYKEILPKLASASLHLIEAQDRVLAGLFDGLNTLRKGDKAGDRPENQY
jgi:hypothetical protein